MLAIVHANRRTMALSFDLDPNSKLRNRKAGYDQFPVSKDGELVDKDTGKGTHLTWCLILFFGALVIGAYVWLAVDTHRIGKLSHHHHHDDDDDDSSSSLPVTAAPTPSPTASDETVSALGANFPYKQISFGVGQTYKPLINGTEPLPQSVPIDGVFVDDFIDQDADAEESSDKNKKNGNIYGNLEFPTFSNDSVVLPTLNVLGYRSYLFQNSYNPSSTQTIFRTPEPVMAVGSQFIVIAGNAGIIVRDKLTGNVTAYSAPIDFFYPLVVGTGPGGQDLRPFDPRVWYDLDAGKYVVMFSAFHSSSFTYRQILIAVSKTSNPFDDWFLYAQAAETDGGYNDFPQMSVSKKSIAISFDERTVGPVGGFQSQLVVLNKASLYAGNAVIGQKFFNLPTSLSPASDLYSSSNDVYFVAQDKYNTESNNNKATIEPFVYRFATKSLQRLSYVTIPESVETTAGLLAQLNSTYLMFGGYGIKAEPVFRNGKIYVVVSYGKWKANKEIFFYAEFSAENIGDFSTTRIVHMESADPSESYAFPALGLSHNGDVAITFSIFSRNSYPSSAYITRRSADDATAWSKPVVYAQGTAPWVARTTTRRNRWGDYLDCKPDASLDNRIWCMGMYSDGVAATNPLDGVTYGQAASNMAAIDFS